MNLARQFNFKEMDVFDNITYFTNQDFTLWAIIFRIFEFSLKFVIEIF